MITKSLRRTCYNAKRGTTRGIKFVLICARPMKIMQFLTNMTLL